MPTKQSQRSGVWFGVMLAVALYVIVSVSLAIATSDSCDSSGSLHGSKTWQPFPPHWECPSR